MNQTYKGIQNGETVAKLGRIVRVIFQSAGCPVHDGEDRAEGSSLRWSIDLPFPVIRVSLRLWRLIWRALRIITGHCCCFHSFFFFSSFGFKALDAEATSCEELTEPKPGNVDQSLAQSPDAMQTICLLLRTVFSLDIYNPE